MMLRRGKLLFVAFAIILAGVISFQAAYARYNDSRWSYKFSETVQVRVFDGVAEPQFKLIDEAPSGFSIGDMTIFTSNLSGQDTYGNPVTGTMHGRCTATGTEERNPPICALQDPDGSCKFEESRSPLFICEQVLRLNDPERGIDGISQLTLGGFVRQIEAQGNPPGQNQKSQWLAITGGTGRFSKAQGQVKYELRETASPPPIKELEVYLNGV